MSLVFNNTIDYLTLNKELIHPFFDQFKEVDYNIFDYKKIMYYVCTFSKFYIIAYIQKRFLF